MDALSRHPKRHSTARLAALGSALVLLGAAAPARAAACPDAHAAPGHAPAKTVGRATVCLLNAERRRHGLPRLRTNRRLALAARRHARDMVRRRYFAHDSASGTDFAARIHRTGYTRGRAWRLAENLGWGGGSQSTPAAMVQAWMNSPGHRVNVLGAFREIGVGLALGAPQPGHPGAATYATEFGHLRR